MIELAKANTLAHLNLWLPLRSETTGIQGVGARWTIRAWIIIFTVLRFIYKCCVHRGSAKPTLFADFVFITVCSVFITAAAAEVLTPDIELRNYHDSLLIVAEGLVGFVVCVRCIANATVPVPGPFLAKFTSLWKVCHLVRGTYPREVINLHRKYGDLIRVGPYEYSIGPPAASVIPEVEKEGHLLDDNKMAQRLYDHEQSIDDCNKTLITSLSKYAKAKTPLQLTRLISCYAWDVMGVTSVGRVFGFMDVDKQSEAVIDRIHVWKLYSVLYGTFFRFHPWLTNLLKTTIPRFRKDLNTKDLLDRVIGEKLGPDIHKTVHESLFDDLDSHHANRVVSKSKILSTFNGITKTPCPGSSFLTTLSALMLVGGDPIAGHVQAALYHLSCHEETVSGLRHDLVNLIPPLSTPPSLQELVGRKDELSHLYAVLHESYRLKNADNYCFPSPDLPKKTLTVAGPIPNQCLLRLNGPYANHDERTYGENADDFSPDRWVDSMKPPFVAFGFTAGNQDIHYALVAKVIIQIVEKFDVKHVATSEETTPHARCNALALFEFTTDLTKQLKNAGIHAHSPAAEHCRHVHHHLGNDFLTTLLEYRGEPEQPAAREHTTLVGTKSDPIPDNNIRRVLHEAIRSLSKGALESKTDQDTKCVVVGLKGFSDYHREGRFQRGSGRGQRGQHGQRSRRGQYGTERAGGRSRGRGQARDFRNSDPRTSGWHTFHNHVDENDRSANAAAKTRIEAEMEAKKAEGFKPSTTYKKTVIVDGVRTLVQVSTNGEVSGGGVALPQQESGVHFRGGANLPANYVPPHKRGKVSVDIKIGEGGTRIDPTLPQNMPDR